MEQAGKSTQAKRVLSPIERVSEVLFGLIMVLTFTGTLSAAQAGRAEVREMLIGAIGCNIAWGLVDAVMYLMGTLSERAKDHRTVLAVRNAGSASEATQAIAEHLPTVVASVLRPEDYERIRVAVSKLPHLPPRTTLGRDDFRGALGIFLLVFLSTFPVILPFVFFGEPTVALRVSNATAVIMMAVLGHAYGKLAGYSPLYTATAMVVLGLFLVAVTIALGG